MRKVLLITAMAVMGWVALAQEVEFSPKAGAYSGGIYTNIYFRFNIKLLDKWKVQYAAETSPCGGQCLLLDVRDTSDPKGKRMFQVTAEQEKQQAQVHEAASGTMMVQAGAKRLLEAKELDIAGFTLYRTDYRSDLMDGALYQSLLVLPGKDYAAVFTFAAANKRDLDEMVADLPKMLSKQ